MPDNDIVLYDIPGTATRDKCWSPNVWKTRFVLNYKAIRCRTSWVEYPDIAPLCAQLGAPPSTIRHDGSPYYSVPFIHDPHTSTYVSDSLVIAQYLETTYPNSPQLFPEGTHASIEAFNDIWRDRVVRHLSPLMMYPEYEQLADASKGYFRTTREARYKTRLEDLVPIEKQSMLWGQVRSGLAQIDAYMGANDRGTFWLGEKLTYADVIMAAWLVWIKRILGPDSKEWKDLISWHDGRWGKLIKEFEKWEYVDDPRAKQVIS